MAAQLKIRGTSKTYDNKQFAISIRATLNFSLLNPLNCCTFVAYLISSWRAKCFGERVASAMIT